MNKQTWVRPIDILLVEDNSGDSDLAREALDGSKFRNTLYVVEDGEKAHEDHAGAGGHLHGEGDE